MISLFIDVLRPPLASNSFHSMSDRSAANTTADDIGVLFMRLSTSMLIRFNLLNFLLAAKENDPADYYYFLPRHRSALNTGIFLQVESTEVDIGNTFLTLVTSSRSWRLC